MIVGLWRQLGARPAVFALAAGLLLVVDAILAGYILRAYVELVREIVRAYAP